MCAHKIPIQVHRSETPHRSWGEKVAMRGFTDCTVLCLFSVRLRNSTTANVKSFFIAADVSCKFCYFCDIANTLTAD